VPSTFSYSSYDTVWLLGLALLEANSTDVDAVKSAIPIIAANYSGAIGPTTLNENGDLKQANYDIWGVRDGEWKKLGNYTKATDSILMN